MSWDLNIPKILHTYWGGGPLVYLRFLTIKSFIKYNPDWQIFIWVPLKPFKGKSWGGTGDSLINRDCNDYLLEILNLPINKIPIDFNALGFSDNTAEVHKADYIRINALNLYGGAWTDMDVIYFRPMTDLKVNREENREKETFVCLGPYGHSTGFLMASDKSRFFSKLTDKFNYEYKPNNYQCWGPDMFNKYFKRISDIPNAVNLDMDVVYAHDCHQVSELLSDNKHRFSDGSIGCHWYAGNSLWGKFLNNTNGGVSNLPKSIITDLINGI